jgi:hypothetical protein
VEEKEVGKRRRRRRGSSRRRRRGKKTRKWRKLQLSTHKIVSSINGNNFASFCIWMSFIYIS